MILFLKHFTFRIWLSILMGGMASLLLLPPLQGQIAHGASPVIVSAAMLIFFFFFIGWLFNRMGGRLVNRLTNEAGIWERAGMHVEAENAYRKAVAVFDSFLISPFSMKNSAYLLMSRLARFYLARPEKDSDSVHFVCGYLLSHPEDSEIAENWLRQVEAAGGLDNKNQEVALRVGESQAENLTVQRLLSRLYLKDGRSDFPALQTYKRVVKFDPNVSVDLVHGLAELFLNEGRADEWALEIYLRSYLSDGDRHRLLRGIAAAVYWTGQSGRKMPLVHEAEKLLTGIDPAKLKKYRKGFNPPIRISAEKVRRDARKAAGPGRFKHLLAVPRFIARLLNAVFSFFPKIFVTMTRSKTSRRFLKGALTAALFLGMIFFVVNTARYLVKPESVTLQKESNRKVDTPGPFTLQVASYQKKELAEKLITGLKKRGIDVYMTRAEGQEKQFYQVRISHFATKDAARTYGKELKEKGLIEDFYVANYRRP